MHAKSEEWLAVSAILLTSPEYLDGDQMAATLKALQSGMSAHPAPIQSQNVREMAAFLTNVMAKKKIFFFWLV
jgi:hypothetical protein